MNRMASKGKMMKMPAQTEFDDVVQDKKPGMRPICRALRAVKIMTAAETRATPTRRLVAAAIAVRKETLM